MNKNDLCLQFFLFLPRNFERENMENKRIFLFMSIIVLLVGKGDYMDWEFMVSVSGLQGHFSCF